MKIWLISNMYPSENMPRYGVFVKNFVNEMKLCGANFKFKSVIRGKQKSKFQKILKYFSLFSSIIYHRVFHQNSVDMIYVHFPLFTSFLLLGIKKDIYLNFHGDELSFKNKLSSLFFFFVKRLVHQRNVKIVVPSSYFQQRLNNYINISLEKFIVYPSGGINTSVFFKANSKHFLPHVTGLDSSTLILGYVSTFKVEKGPYVLLDALVNLKQNYHLDFQVIMVGDGPERANIIDFIQQNDLDNCVQLLEGIDHQTLNLIYNQIDLFIFPSMRKNESLGLVGIEALATGTPVVGSNYAGIKTYVQDGINGYLFKIGESVDLVQKVVDYTLLTEEEKGNMQKEAVSTAEKYDSKKVTKILYQKLQHH